MCTVGFNAPRQCSIRTNVNWIFCPAQPKLIGQGNRTMSDVQRLAPSLNINFIHVIDTVTCNQTLLLMKIYQNLNYS